MPSPNMTIETIRIEDDGVFPGKTLPVILYRRALDPGDEPAREIERVFTGNGWGGTWRNGIFAYHHYHAAAHEVLGCARGTVRVQLGGPQGAVVDISAGDIVLLPAGTAHKNLGDSGDLLIIGAYPPGQSPDMRYGEPGERPSADRLIAKVPLPDTDPVTGSAGPLHEHWIARHETRPNT